MSYYTFSQRPFLAVPPEKGSFPLDHEGECKGPMLKHMRCLVTNNSDNSKCRRESMDYLGCRMDHGLMKRDTWEHLGFGDIAPKPAEVESPAQSTSSSPPPEKHD